MWEYIVSFFLAMVPLLELRFAVMYAISKDIHPVIAVILCAIGNMVPVPFIYLFARKFLLWGSEKRFIGKICRFFVRKGERAGQKLVGKAGRGGLFVALMLFVGIPLPGTGAWTGTLGASFLNMGIKSTVASVCLGVVIAGAIIATIFATGLHILGF